MCMSSLNDIADEKHVFLCLFWRRFEPYTNSFSPWWLLPLFRSEAQLAAELASQHAATQRAIAVVESEQSILSRTVRSCVCSQRRRRRLMARIINTRALQQMKTWEML